MILTMAWLLAWLLKISKKLEFVVIGAIMGCAIGMAALSLLSLTLHSEGLRSLETDTHQQPEPSEPLPTK